MYWFCKGGLVPRVQDGLRSNDFSHADVSLAYAVSFRIVAILPSFTRLGKDCPLPKRGPNIHD